MIAQNVCLKSATPVDLKNSLTKLASDVKQLLHLIVPFDEENLRVCRMEIDTSLSTLKKMIPNVDDGTRTIAVDIDVPIEFMAELEGFLKSRGCSFVPKTVDISKLGHVGGQPDESYQRTEDSIVAANQRIDIEFDDDDGKW